MFSIIFGELRRYGLVGVVNTIVGISVMRVAYELSGSHYLSYFLGYAIGGVLSFTLSQSFVFQRKTRGLIVGKLYFVLAAALSYLVGSLVLSVLVRLSSLDTLICYILSMGAYTASNFLLQKTMVFTGR